MTAEGWLCWARAPAPEVRDFPGEGCWARAQHCGGPGDCGRPRVHRGVDARDDPARRTRRPRHRALPARAGTPRDRERDLPVPPAPAR